MPTKRKPDTYERARHLILSDILQFYITRQWPNDNNRCTPATRGFIPAGPGLSHLPQVGDLVIVQYAPATKWNLGWLREMSNAPGGIVYTVESLEDQSLCNWSNVGIAIMPHEHIRTRYRWSDRQFEFQKRLAKVAAKVNDYSIRLQDTAFDGDDAVIIAHERWGFAAGEIPHPFFRRVKNWRKLTMGNMAGVLMELQEEASARSIAKKKVDQPDESS